MLYLRVILIVILCLQSMMVQAHLSISPPQIILSDKGIALTEVQSTDSVTTYWQVRVVSWKQEDGKDVLQPASEIPITPRFFHVKPGESQVIRALFPHEKARYFRILIEQVPENPEAQGVTLKFTFSLPVYFYPNEPVQHSIDFPADKSCMAIANSTDRVEQLMLSFQPQGIPVVLPGATMQICKKDNGKL